mmetsp:Transcript_3172/g.7130  ORF Transcript_3172/g.7130 Transcript_3172/m.7130 type:complete len:144 (+) Transcript_3172:91-522(+)
MVPLFALILVSALAPGAVAHGQAVNCTGSADPTGTVPYCFCGGQLGETVSLKVTSFASEKGTVDVSGSGLETIACSGKAFTKNGQTLTGDWTDCVKPPITISSILFCSDQNQVLVNCQVGPVPTASPLTPCTCPSEATAPLVV